MSSAKENTFYTVKSGDTTRNIARSAYGRDLNALIYDANYETLKDRKISFEGLPTLYAGDVLFIPPYKNKYDGKPVTADFDTEIELRINGQVVNGANASRISRAMNTISGGFAVQIPIDLMDANTAQLLRPFTFHPAELRIGGNLYLTARVVKIDFESCESGKIATVECRTAGGDMIECTGMRASRTFKSGMTLLDICREVAKPYGITCYASNGSGGVTEAPKTTEKDPPRFAYDENAKAIAADTSESVGRIEQGVTETDAEFLQKLCIQKGFLLASLPDGNLLLCRANTADKPADSLIEGQDRIKYLQTSHDGTGRFSKWSASTAENGEPAISHTEKDTEIKINRSTVFEATETDNANIKTAVKWRVAKSVADSYGVNLVVIGWYNAAGELWAENMKVSVKFPSAFIFNETEFIIESVELTKDDGGDIATMRLVLPSSYTTDAPKKPFPWDL